MGVDNPRVALLSNGEEAAKGTADVLAAHEQLSGSSGKGLNFIGNIEGTQVTASVADVVVMDGFTGNITLKVIEGVSQRTMRAIRDVAMRSLQGRIGGWLLAPAIKDLRTEIDPETPGGAYMLGLRRVGVVAHGRFTRRGFARAIEVAARGVEEDVISKTRAALQTAGALREPGPGVKSSGSSERAATV
jgi:glycerol-3-phosphate acyltransferase PlsX